MTALLEYSLALLPVLLFLAALMVLDSFKLVRLRAILFTILIGGLTAVILIYLNSWLFDWLELSRVEFTRYLAPVTEEILKSLFLVYVIATNRTGFLVDSAIRGFAVGAGFALVENVFYHVTLSDQSITLWIVRGFGTACLHGGTMTLFAIISRTARDRQSLPGLAAFMPGLILAIVVHSLFNHFLLPPVVLTIMTLVTLGLMTIIVFNRSEKITRDWLGSGLDLDMDVIDSISTGEISDTRVGKYLNTLIDKFKPIVVADMLCLLRIHAELAVAAKGILLAQEAGLQLPPDDSLKAKLEELAYLERSVGRTGRLALHPFLLYNSVQQWQKNLLVSSL